MTMPEKAQPELPHSPPLQGERVAFTGTLASMTHRDAKRVVEEHGGQPAANVSRQLSMLVVGEEGWPLEADGKVSQKLQHALELQLIGCEIRILKESDWLHLLGLGERQREVQRLHTPAMLSQMLNVSVGQIRRWERLGLIKAAKRVHRLPYFDYEEVSTARRLAELLAAGVPRGEIEASLEKLKSWFPNIEQPLAQLQLLQGDRRLVIRDDVGIVEAETGQRLFDFLSEDVVGSEDSGSAELTPTLQFAESTSIIEDRSDWSASQWFAEGCRLLEEASAGDAVEAFRMCLMLSPGDPETHRNLAEALYRSGNRQGAIERYYMAVESDRQFIEAWTQLGCLLDELNQTEDAENAFRIALDTHPDFADACFHLADLLWRTRQSPEALDLWRKYLVLNSRGLWADIARQRLEQATAPKLLDPN